MRNTIEQLIADGPRRNETAREGESYGQGWPFSDSTTSINNPASAWLQAILQALIAQEEAE